MLSQILNELVEVKTNTKEMGLDSLDGMKTFGSSGKDIKPLKVELEQNEKILVDIMSEYANHKEWNITHVAIEDLKERYKKESGRALTPKILDSFMFCLEKGRTATMYKDHRNSAKGDWRQTTKSTKAYRVDWLKGYTGTSAYKKAEEMIRQVLMNSLVMNLKTLGYKQYNYI